MMQTSGMIAAVAINARAFMLFDYLSPAEDIVGRRVLVPLGGKQTVGLVMAQKRTSEIPPNKLKKILRTYDDMPPLPAATLELIQFCARYYHCPLGIVAAAVLPAYFRRPKVCPLPMGYRLGKDPAPLYPRRKKAHRVCEWLRGKDGQTVAAITAAVGTTPAFLRQLAKEGFLTREIVWHKNVAIKEAADTPPLLTKEQKNALAEVVMDGYSPYLLFGETGSGKTEIYLQLTAQALANGGQALILLPEIHLTPQVEAVFRRRFPTRRVCVLHSALPDGERAQQWHMALVGQADIVLGTRLAVFTPLPALKIIVVDEEHDDSYRQDSGLLFSARDVAVWRARHEKATLVCGSATPSLESYANARRGQYKLLRMKSRTHRGKITVSLIKEEGGLFHGLTQSLLSALADELNAGGQALIFINRRGYAPSLVCGQCGWLAHCAACNASMTWHRRRQRLICHRCGRQRAVPPQCESCGGSLVPLGFGTQRIEEALAARFSPMPVVRLDSDSLARRGSFDKIRQHIAEGQARLLVGTQIVAKGHNFPHLSFIGIINADSGLFSANFRAEERLYMLLRQVIGRGTRNVNGCRVFIQTRHPTHPFYQNLQADDLTPYWEQLLAARRRNHWPPFTHLALLRASAVSEKKLGAFFRTARQLAQQLAKPNVKICDPIPAPVEKIAGRWRWQLATQSSSRLALHQFLRQWRVQLPAAAGIRWALEVDPLEI